MYYIEITLFLIGVVLLVVGYRTRNRNMMLSAAIILFMSAAVDSLAGGFLEGFQQSRAGHQASLPS
ncbi:MAG: hypothetical protein LH491_07510 [Pseudoxanthomonas sp.]|nr:hypothetical protein [Pseudoxanthomonas sp.]